MNTFEILYQAFRARYSLARVQEILDRGLKLALIGWEGLPEKLQGYLGPPLERLEGTSPTEELTIVELPLDDESAETLDGCDAAIIYLGENVPEPDELRAIADKLPIEVPCLWLYDGERPRYGDDLTLPQLLPLASQDQGAAVCSYLMKAFPEVSLMLARDFQDFRRLYSRRLIHKTAARNALIAACSNLPVKTVPVVGWALSLLAVTGEILVLTASQLRLCLLVAALHGRPLDFFDRVGELWPVVGGAFGWRAVARELVGMAPVAGWAMKASIAYGGTWAVGEASRLYYVLGSPTDEELRRELNRKAKRAAALATDAFMSSLGDLEELEREVDDDMDDLTRPESEEEAQH